jgi:metal-sulfur cluster biosynthetic enzyme
MDEKKPESDSPTQSTDATTEGAASVGDASAVDGPTENRVTLALRKVKDPELGLNIIDLGLVYEILIEGNDVEINMTLTSPGCPAGPQIMTDVENAVKALPGVGDVTLNLVWTPYWTPERIEPRVRAYMGL